jgi:hypothetical protein
MSKIALEGNASGTGTFTIAGPNTNTNYTITLPQETGTLITTGITTGLNGSAISTGVVAASVGGTGLTSAGTNGNVLTSNGSAWVSQAAAAGGGDYIMQVFTTPGTWTKPAGLKAIKVTVIGGGGGATSNPSAPAGGTSSFGSPAFLSATGGGSGNVLNSTASGGTGSGGQLNSSGAGSYYWNTGPYVFVGGGSAFGFALPTPISVSVGGSAYGGGARLIDPAMPVNGAAGGGGGGAIEYIDAPALPGPQPYTVGTGAPATQSGAAGVVIVEEFY